MPDAQLFVGGRRGFSLPRPGAVIAVTLCIVPLRTAVLGLSSTPPLVCGILCIFRGVCVDYCVAVTLTRY